MLRPERGSPSGIDTIKLQKTLEQLAPELRGIVPHAREAEKYSGEQSPKVTDRAREAAKARVRRTTPETAPTLDELGACAPFDYSAREVYLVATIQDDGGLALWEVARRRRVRELEEKQERR